MCMARELEQAEVTKESIIITTLFYKIPPHLPLPAFGRKKIPKGGTIPLFGRRPIGPLARRAKGLGEIFRRICLLNCGLIINIKGKGVKVIKGDFVCYLFIAERIPFLISGAS